MKIKLGFSSCPNDTFMFDALVNGRLDTGDLEFEIYIGDILHLNQKAMQGELDMVKLSYNTLGRVLDQYALLDAGSALGFGCGPLLISNGMYSLSEMETSGKSIAIPGRYTTASLLLNFYAPQLTNRQEMLFHEVMPAVKRGDCIGGVIIHENRFTYQREGLVCLQDLGAFWEEKTGLPIPLGAIAARRSLGTEMISRLENLMRQSVEYAFAHPEISRDFVCEYAQEMEEEVMQAHIGLYVNDFSVSLGAKGREAVARLFAEGEKMGLYSTNPTQILSLS
ncbi:MAG: 1,4-dihydroxy-6-naphthoate synthase [Bacteroidia bacterium]|nr:1,4-dihydroxy-6-naphthoate synthase [Bacteroidia bacterium]